MTVSRGTIGKILMSAFVFGLFMTSNSSRGVEVAKAAADDNTAKTKPAAEKYIVKDGIPQGKIFLPAVAEKAMIFAAQELREHLGKMTGTDVEISWRAISSNDGGFLLKTRPESEWRGKESSQAFTIEESVSPVPRVTVTGNTSLAVLYGVYQYLNDQGVRWLTPGETGTNIPRLSDIPVRPGKKTASPSFSSRTLALSSVADNHFGGAPDIKKAVYDYDLYLIRNRTQLGRNIATKDFGFDLCGTQSGHAVKPMTGLNDTSISKEPERFALVTGPDFVQKRRFDDGQICFSNEKNIRTAIENCVAYFTKLDNAGNGRSRDLDEDFTVPMGLSDCSGICECENCAKIAGKEPNSKDRLVWWFWNRVAKGLSEKMPGRRMAVFAPYADITRPPADVKIEPNIMAVTCQVMKWEKNPENKASYPFPKAFLENITGIRDAGATLGCYDYQNYPWAPTPLLVLDSAQGYAELGYKHYHLEAMQRTEYDWPIIWSIAQFTWDSSKKPREYLKDFCREYYGTPYDADILWLLEEM
ncbi:MAG: DUF4838 domain-containing protein, partial [bacterium]|nr:DUF4838 domain-containing protein [bacterium]